MDGSAVAQGDRQVIDSRAIGIDLERWSRADIQSRITDQTQDFAGCICKESFALIEIIRAI